MCPHPTSSFFPLAALLSCKILAPEMFLTPGSIIPTPQSFKTLVRLLYRKVISVSSQMTHMTHRSLSYLHGLSPPFHLSSTLVAHLAQSLSLPGTKLGLLTPYNRLLPLTPSPTTFRENGSSDMETSSASCHQTYQMSPWHHQPFSSLLITGRGPLS